MSGAELPPLHGVPVAMKDLFDFKPGWPATFGGIRALRDNVIDAHCVFAERIEQGGAIIVGKTNSPVMGFRGVTDNPLFGPSRNPFDTTRNTGGSSGGSGRRGRGRARLRSPRAPTAEARSASPPRGAASTASRRRGVACRWSSGRTRSAAIDPFLAEGPITRTVADAALAMTVIIGLRLARPIQPGRASSTTGDAPDQSIKRAADRLLARISASTRSTPSWP